jgi:hypothetical protein
MKGVIHYILDHLESTKQATDAYNSFKHYNCDVELKAGITPATLDSYNNYKVLKNSRLESFLVKDKNERKHKVKKSCVLNNIEFAKMVIAKDEPMMFIEHDALCIDIIDNIDFDEVCFMAIETWNKPPSGLALSKFMSYNITHNLGVNDFPEDWPLKYTRDTKYKGSSLIPGTMCYGLTPKGAKKIIREAETSGLEQSDFIINSSVVRLQYVYPSPVKHQKVNLNLSHRL